MSPSQGFAGFHPLDRVFGVVQSEVWCACDYRTAILLELRLITQWAVQVGVQANPFDSIRGVQSLAHPES